MKKNQLGRSDLYVSELTLGCMSLGTNKDKAKDIIDHALSLGVNHLDTADLYDFGMNEEIVGQAIKGKRNQIVLTTKVGNHFDKDTKDWFWDPSKTHIKEGVKNSLLRLKTDYIDFYMLHGGTIEDPINETIEAFDELKKDGLIRAYGISSIRPNVIREYIKRSSIDGVMMQYNMLDRRPEEEMLDLLHEHHISVLARGPLAKGMLSNKGEIQINQKGKDGYLDYSYKELKAILEKVSKSTDERMNVLALNYVRKHPAVASAVFGASSVRQVEENASFDHSKEMPDETYAALQNITRPIRYENHR